MCLKQHQIKLDSFFYIYLSSINSNNRNFKFVKKILTQKYRVISVAWSVAFWRVEKKRVRTKGWIQKKKKIKRQRKRKIKKKKKIYYKEKSRAPFISACFRFIYFRAISIYALKGCNMKSKILINIDKSSSCSHRTNTCYGT